MSNTEERVAKLERTLRDVKVAGIVIGLALAIFLGYTWASIPRQIADTLKGEAVKPAESAAKAYADSASIYAASAKSQFDRASTLVKELDQKRPNSANDAMTRTIQAHDGLWGDWSRPVMAPPNYYVAGIAVRFENDQRGGDDTALNAVQLYCCPFSSAK